MNWQATVKTAFMLKAGYQTVDYDEDWNNDGSQAIADTLNDGEDTFHFEAQAIWQATRKSNFLLNSKYNIEQSDSRYALNKTVWASRLAYGYRFTGRIRGTLNFIYEDSDYAQFDGSSRLDERWNFSPSIDFAIKNGCPAPCITALTRKILILMSWITKQIPWVSVPVVLFNIFKKIISLQ